MSVRRETRGHLPPTLLGVYEHEARDRASAVRREGEATARGNYPKRTGQSAREIRGRVTRTPEGLAITVAPPRRREYVYRFVEAGTGERGPLGRRIPPNKRGRLADGRVPSGRGQAPQRPFARTRDALTARVIRELERGAQAASEKLLRGLGL